MIDENDSLDPGPLSVDEMIAEGIFLGATHTLICYDFDQDTVPEAVYVMPGECAYTIEKACSRSSFCVVSYPPL